jgi:hypothetical protein
MAMKLAHKLDGLLELPQFKDNQELTKLIQLHFQDALPKTYKGSARIRSENNFLYSKIADKPKPTDLNGRPLSRVRDHAAVCISELPEIKDENKLRKAAGKPLMDAVEKKKMLKTLLKNPAFKQAYKDKYVTNYNKQREEYKAAQLRNPMAQNQAYILDPETLEYRQRDTDDTSDSSDDECNIQNSD